MEIINEETLALSKDSKTNSQDKLLEKKESVAEPLKKENIYNDETLALSKDSIYDKHHF